MKTNKWRLPTIDELKLMYDIENSKSISGFNSDNYWSSTTFGSDTSLAWVIYFNCGGVYRTSKTRGVASVRCVRELDDNMLELSQSSERTMNYYEAIEYAKNLEVDDKDIVKVKLDGLLYKQVSDTEDIFNSYDYLNDIDDEYEFTSLVLSMAIFGKRTIEWSRLVNEVINLTFDSQEKNWNKKESIQKYIQEIDNLLTGRIKNIKIKFLKDRYKTTGMIKRNKKNLVISAKCTDKFCTPMKELIKLKLPEEYIQD